jgi:predicted dehydrogenase
MPSTRIAVIGAGAFGRNHLRVWHELTQAHPDVIELVALADPSPAARQEASTRFGVPAYATVAELLAAHRGLHAASVAVPTTQHAAVASDLLRAGVDVLIEKPFAPTLREADEVLSLAASLGRIVAVAHLERFNPAVTAAAAQLTRPMFFESHRLSIFTPRSLDVDVVLDLMIHDLDIVLALAHSPVREVRGVGLPVLSRKVDIANVRVEFDSGCVANFTASRVSTEQVRKLRLFQPRQYLSLDFARQELLTIEVSAGQGAQMLAAAQTHLPEPAAVPQPHPSAGLSFVRAEIEKAEPLRLELQDFLRAVRTRTPPRVTGEAGRAALALALQVNEEIAAHARRAGLA